MRGGLPLLGVLGVDAAVVLRRPGQRAYRLTDQVRLAGCVGRGHEFWLAQAVRADPVAVVVNAVDVEHEAGVGAVTIAPGRARVIERAREFVARGVLGGVFPGLIRHRAPHDDGRMVSVPDDHVLHILVGRLPARRRRRSSPSPESRPTPSGLARRRRRGRPVSRRSA